MKGLAEYHIHKRKRNSKEKLAPYPHPHFWGWLLDKVTLAAGILAPFMVAPQVIQIFSTQSAVGVSALTWGLFAILDIPFILYGVAHKNKLIITTYILLFVANVVVVFGALLYG